MLKLRGDVGPKAMIGANASDVREVPIDSDEVLIEIDTRETWEKVRDRLQVV
jgi:CTP:molybdopterin cytidylyltransferase MocA